MILVAEYIPFFDRYVQKVSTQMGLLKSVEANKVLNI